jgi:hypothetical protein
VAEWITPSAPSVPFDLKLALRGAVTLIHRVQGLDAATEQLRRHGYRVLVADAGSWSDSAAMHADLARLLEFPDYYGANLDALNDSLGELVTRPAATSPAAADAAATCSAAAACGPAVNGIALALLRFDAFARRDPSTAHALSDIIAQQARVAALYGVRLLGLLQSDDATLELPEVGATPVSWTDFEPPDAEPRPRP